MTIWGAGPAPTLDDNSLRCPHCGGSNLHHEWIEIFDQSACCGATYRVSVDSGGVGVRIGPDTWKDNPSARRNGLKIFFSCETCPEKPVLSIAQHKGDTLLAWGPGAGGQAQIDGGPIEF